MGPLLTWPALRAAAGLALGLTVSLVASDVLLRGAYLSPRQFQLDPVLGVDRVPHAEVLVAREGGARLRFDRYGLNNDDSAWDRPGPRLGILGDSFIEAAEVPRAANAVARLGEAMPQVVVLNLGRAAASPAHAVTLWRRLAARGERFDLLVLAISDNDLDELRALSLEADCTLPEEPPPSPPRVALATAIQQSPLLMRLNLRARDWRQGLGAGAPKPAAAVAADGATCPAAADPALAARLVPCLRVLAQAQPVALLVLPGGDLPVTAARRMPGLRRLATVRAAAAEAGIAWVIDAWGEFGTDPLGDGRKVNGFANHVLGTGHLNPAGHARLAELLARDLLGNVAVAAQQVAVVPP